MQIYRLNALPRSLLLSTPFNSLLARLLAAAYFLAIDESTSLAAEPTMFMVASIRIVMRGRLTASLQDEPSEDKAPVPQAEDVSSALRQL